jgi:hypothetical protein
MKMFFWLERSISAVTKFCLVGGILVLGGILLSLFSSWRDIKGSYFSDTASFGSTEGKIVSSSAYQARRRRGGGVHYYYSIKYEFAVDNKSYNSDKITFASNSSYAQRFAQSYVSKYPVGKPVTVYYDPDDPSFSVLEPEVKGDFSIYLWVIGVSALVAALSGGYLLIRKPLFGKRLELS